MRLLYNIQAYQLIANASYDHYHINLLESLLQSNFKAVQKLVCFLRIHVAADVECKDEVEKCDGISFVAAPLAKEFFQETSTFPLIRFDLIIC